MMAFTVIGMIFLVLICGWVIFAGLGLAYVASAGMGTKGDVIVGLVIAGLGIAGIWVVFHYSPFAISVIPV